MPPRHPAHFREDHPIVHNPQKGVAVLGAGVAGLVSAKVLAEDGFDVSVFEKESTVGGVWAESRAYPGLRTNNPREAYVFSDFDYPSSADAFPTAGQVREYLEAYADHFGVAPRIHLDTEVLSVARGAPKAEGGHPGFRVTVRRVGGGRDSRAHDPEAADPEALDHERHEVDFVVVCNGVFSAPSVPDLEGRERFEGRVLLSSQLADPEAIRGKRVIVVGAGKSALDCAAAAAEEAASATLVFRRPHWMLPRYFGPIRVDKALFNRLSLQVFPAYHDASRAERVLRLVAAPLFWLWRKAVTLVARRVGKVCRPRWCPRSP